MRSNMTVIMHTILNFVYYLANVIGSIISFKLTFFLLLLFIYAAIKLVKLIIYKGDFMKGINLKSLLLIMLGWISALLSIFTYPFIFGFTGVVAGVLASKDRNKAGLPVVVASILLMGIGLMFGNYILSYTIQIFKHIR